MDLNSYLTDFFSMINNQNSNFFGGSGLSGGAPPAVIAHLAGLNNKQILEHYFQPSSINNPSVDNSDQLLFKDAAKEAEFKQHQVEIVKYMLIKDPAMRGGMYGGQPDADTVLASAVAAKMTSQTPTGGPAGGPAGVVDCKLLELAKLNTSVYNSDNFKFSNALELQKCFNEIITYIKSLSNDKEDQDDLRNKLSLKYKGAVINDGSDEDDYRNKMSLNLVGYKF